MLGDVELQALYVLQNDVYPFFVEKCLDAFSHRVVRLVVYDDDQCILLRQHPLHVKQILDVFVYHWFANRLGELHAVHVVEDDVQLSSDRC